MNDGIASDDKQTSRVISMFDGAKAVGWDAAVCAIASMIAELARRRRIEGIASEGYATALNDVLVGIQMMQEARRKA